MLSWLVKLLFRVTFTVGYWVFVFIGAVIWDVKWFRFLSDEDLRRDWKFITGEGKFL